MEMTVFLGCHIKCQNIYIIQYKSAQPTAKREGVLIEKPTDTKKL